MPPPQRPYRRHPPPAAGSSAARRLIAARQRRLASDAKRQADSRPENADITRTPEVRNAEGPEAAAFRARLNQSPLLLPAVLGLVTVVLGGFAVWFGVKAHNLNSEPSARNTALTDSAATSQLDATITSAANTIFSYNYADAAKTQHAARALLTGPAVEQYQNLFKAVRKDAAALKLVVTTTVTNSGVEMLDGHRARVLVFADERDTGTTTKQPVYSGAMFAVNAVYKDGTWKIDDIDTFTGPA